MTAGVLPLDRAAYEKQVQKTRQLLDTVDDTSLVDLARLGIGEIQLLKQEVSEIFPASNLPALLLQGLMQIDDRTLKQDRVAADLRVLFRGSRQIGLYGTFLAAPALVLYGYQRLLALSGKDVESLFPAGEWQFYTQFGLREDAARHSAETQGFQDHLPNAEQLDAATCWVYAAMHTLHTYHGLLENEWVEWVTFRMLDLLLEEQAVAALGKRLPRKQNERDEMVAEQVAELRRSYQIDGVVKSWVARRPYANPPTTPHGDYVAYRRSYFQNYLKRELRHLPPELRIELDARVALRRDDRRAYQSQMTLMTTLQADSYQERMAPLASDRFYVALVVGGRYYLLDACARDAKGNLLVFPADAKATATGLSLPLTTDAEGVLHDPHGHVVDLTRFPGVRINGRLLGYLRPPPLEQVKQQVAAVLRKAGRPPADLPETDLLLARSARERQQALRSKLSEATQAELELLRYAPIIVNWDRHSGDQPLTRIRQTRRGCGDHALTIIRTEKRMVFDMSHIFFDATWGMALAEIITNQATALYPLVRDVTTGSASLEPLRLEDTPAFLKEAREVADNSPAEAAAETTTIDLPAINRLRRRLPKLQLSLTVNDLLLLGRCIHASSYSPGPRAEAALAVIAGLEGGEALARQIVRTAEEQRLINPALLIPMNASAVDPKLRLYPATFRNPLPELLPLLDRCDALIHQMRHANDETAVEQFEQARRALYRELFAFGAFLHSLRDSTMRGKSFTASMLRLLGNLPSSMQNMLDQIPQRIGLLNEIIKGTEVFSNVGQVAPTSSLTRFASARDDGVTKLLIWGIMSDTKGHLVVTLRDFRPHVAPLLRQGRADLADALARDYLEAYANCVNTLVGRIQRIMAYK